MTRNPLVKLSPPEFDCAQLMVVGDVMLDWYWHGSTSRISPEAPVPVVHVQSEETRVGGAGNVALNAAALGAQVRLLGLAGEDVHADRIENLLREGGVECFLQRVAGSKTITKLRILSRHQQMIRADFEDHFPARNGDELIFSFERHLQEVDAVVLSDYAKGSLHDSKNLIAAARRAGKHVIVDPKGADSSDIAARLSLRPTSRSSRPWSDIATPNSLSNRKAPPSAMHLNSKRCSSRVARKA